MTTRQLVLMICAYLAVMVATAYFTRAKVRRIAGALVGGAAAGWWGLGAVALGEALGWWRVPTHQPSYFWTLVYLGFAISLAPVYLLTWRVERRFGWRGLAVCLGAVVVAGPPRDYFVAATYPEWMVFSPGIVPVLAVSATYLGWVALGHAMMRVAAGPSRGDELRGRASRFASEA